MSVTLNDPVMKGYLISLGFSRPESSTEEDGEKGLSDAYENPIIGDTKILTEHYSSNKRKISLVRKRLYECANNEDKRNVLEDTLLFMKKTVEAGLTYHPERNFERQGTTLQCSDKELQLKIEKELSRLSESKDIRKQLDVIYQRLLEYAPNGSVNGQRR